MGAFVRGRLKECTASHPRFCLLLYVFLSCVIFQISLFDCECHFYPTDVTNTANAPSRIQQTISEEAPNPKVSYWHSQVPPSAFTVRGACYPEREVVKITSLSYNHPKPSATRNRNIPRRSRQDDRFFDGWWLVCRSKSKRHSFMAPVVFYGIFCNMDSGCLFVWAQCMAPARKAAPAPSRMEIIGYSTSDSWPEPYMECCGSTPICIQRHWTMGIEGPQNLKWQSSDVKWQDGYKSTKPATSIGRLLLLRTKTMNYWGNP